MPIRPHQKLLTQTLVDPYRTERIFGGRNVGSLKQFERLNTPPRKICLAEIGFKKQSKSVDTTGELVLRALKRQ